MSLASSTVVSNYADFVSLGFLTLQRTYNNGIDNTLNQMGLARSTLLIGIGTDEYDYAKPWFQGVRDAEVYITNNFTSLYTTQLTKADAFYYNQYGNYFQDYWNGKTSTRRILWPRPFKTVWHNALNKELTYKLYDLVIISPVGVTTYADLTIGEYNSIGNGIFTSGQTTLTTTSGVNYLGTAIVGNTLIYGGVAGLGNSLRRAIISRIPETTTIITTTSFNASGTTECYLAHMPSTHDTFFELRYGTAASGIGSTGFVPVGCAVTITFSLVRASGATTTHTINAITGTNQTIAIGSTSVSTNKYVGISTINVAVSGVGGLGQTSLLFEIWSRGTT